MKKEMKERIFYCIIGGISDIEHSLNRLDFEHIFGKGMGKNIWDKFIENSYSLTVLFNYLDSKNRSKLIKYLMKRIRLGIGGK